ncbi:MAG: glutamate formimidoyltransferase [Armatimonadetes bacterium JP3_11]|nr:MAG: glutamate formimidoyltransferase [Armatimonadetes bacterium JP3_11]
MAGARVLCVPNFSEGRDEATIHAIADAAASAGVQLHHLSWDYDHHRMVLAFSGTPAQVKRAVLQAGVVAVARIDLNRHRGAHPRIGAVDVVPFVPLAGLTREQAVAFSHRVAKSFARRLRVPVYLYEYSAREGRPRDLPTLRKGEFEGWIGKRLTGEREPDFGPKRLHPTAGATIMGVRDPLIAFNLNLHPPDVAVARQIARQIRTERNTNPALHGVRALGLWLPTRGVAQVSLNITQTEQTDLFRVTETVRHMAHALGAEIAETELIGVILADDAARALRSALGLKPIEAQQIVPRSEV